MIEKLPPVWRNTALVVLGLLVVWFAWSIRSVVNPLLLGYLFAYILHPAVAWFEDRGFSRRIAVGLVFGLGFLVFVGVVLGIGLQMKQLVVEVIGNEAVHKKISAAIKPALDWVRERVPQLESAVPPELLQVDSALAWIGEFVQSHQEEAKTAGAATVEAAGGILGVVKRVIGGFVAIGGLFLLVPLYTYYFLFELRKVNAWFAHYTPRGERERLVSVTSQIGLVLSNFFRGRLLVCLLKGAVITVGLWVCGVPFAFLFGMMGGFFSVIPFIGPMLSFVGALLAALGVGEMGLLEACLKTGIVFGVAEVLEGYVFIPKVMGDTLGLHPLTVLFAMFAGGAALGMFGILISLPLAATIVILFRELVKPALEDLAEERGAPGA